MTPWQRIAARVQVRQRCISASDRPYHEIARQLEVLELKLAALAERAGCKRKAKRQGAK